MTYYTLKLPSLCRGIWAIDGARNECYNHLRKRLLNDRFDNYVSSHLITGMPELHACLDHANPLCDYLVDIVGQYGGDPFAWGKQIWDLAAIGYLMHPGFSTSGLTPSPIITDGLTYSFDARRHLIRTVRSVSRDSIFRDCFTKLRKAPQ